MEIASTVWGVTSRPVLLNLFRFRSPLPSIAAFPFTLLQFLRCFRDAIRVPRIRENHHIGSLESENIGSLYSEKSVHTGFLTLKKILGPTVNIYGRCDNNHSTLDIRCHQTAVFSLLLIHSMFSATHQIGYHLQTWFETSSAHKFFFATSAYGLLEKSKVEGFY